MSWQEITTLHNEGYDVESHSMSIYKITYY